MGLLDNIMDKNRRKPSLSQGSFALTEQGKVQVQADFTSGDDHIRLLVVLRPGTLLGDLVPTDVLYEITARAPTGEWDSWEQIFTILFESFQPLDCGGV